jgi:hypothetical protein
MREEGQLPGKRAQEAGKKEACAGTVVPNLGRAFS